MKRRSVASLSRAQNRPAKVTKKEQAADPVAPYHSHGQSESESESERVPPVSGPWQVRSVTYVAQGSQIPSLPGSPATAEAEAGQLVSVHTETGRLRLSVV